MLYALCIGVLLTSWPVAAIRRERGSRDDADVTCEHPHNQSQLNSFLWTIKGNPPSYLFGTIHVPYTRVWDFIPDNTKVAFDQAHNVFFELDLTDPYTISALSNCQLLPHGEYLSNILPSDIYKRLKRHLDYVRGVMADWMTTDQKGRGLYADYLFNAIAGNWERKRPVWVMLMVNSLTERDIRSRGIPVLDLYLAQEAERMDKQTGAVERVEEQCVPLNELNFSQVLFALNQTLRQHERYRLGATTLPYTTQDLIQHYNCGDLNSVIFNHDTAQVPNLVNSSLPPKDLTTAKKIDDYFREELIYRRNDRMAGRVMRLLKTHPNKSFFFAFGAGHFLGNNTVIDRLRLQGYTIEHTSPVEQVYRGSVRHRNKKKKQHHHRYRQMAPVSEFPVSPLLNGGYLDPFYDRRRNRQRNRNRHRQSRRRDRDRSRHRETKIKQFNDLWVRLDVASIGPHILRNFRSSTTTKGPSSLHWVSASPSHLHTHFHVVLCCLTVSLLYTFQLFDVIR